MIMIDYKTSRKPSFSAAYILARVSSISRCNKHMSNVVFYQVVSAMEKEKRKCVKRVGNVCEWSGLGCDFELGGQGGHH